MYTPSIVTTHRTCKRASRHSSMSPLIDEPILMGGAALATTPHVPTPPLLSLTRHHRSGQAAVAPSAPTPHPRRMSQQSAVAGRRRPGFRVSSPVKERIGSNCGARNTPRHRMPPIPKAQRSPGQQYVRIFGVPDAGPSASASHWIRIDLQRRCQRRSLRRRLLSSCASPLALAQLPAGSGSCFSKNSASSKMPARTHATTLY